MLPDFPQVKKKRGVLIRRMLARMLSKTHPLVHGLPGIVVYEGLTTAYPRKGGKLVRRPVRAFGAEVQIHVDELVGLDNEHLLLKWLELGTNISNQQTTFAYSEIDKAARSTRKGPKRFFKMMGIPSKEEYLKHLREYEMDFTPAGQPMMPSPQGPPAAIQELFKASAQWLQDPVFLAQFRQVIDQKRIEFREREADRRLVD